MLYWRYYGVDLFLGFWNWLWWWRCWFSKIHWFSCKNLNQAKISWKKMQDHLMGSTKQSAGLLDSIRMERFRTVLTHRYPWPHEHSRHAVIAVVVGCLFFISSDNIHNLVEKLDKNIKWWFMYACLFGFFYFFSSPFIWKTIKLSYSNFSRW